MPPLVSIQNPGSEKLQPVLYRPYPNSIQMLGMEQPREATIQSTGEQYNAWVYCDIQVTSHEPDAAL